MSSSKRSSSIPSSYASISLLLVDRFRIRSFPLTSFFSSHRDEPQVQQNPDRSWLRKTQVHPHAHKSSKEPPNDSAVHLFHAHGRMLSKRSASLAEGLSQKDYPDKSSSSSFDLRRSPMTKTSPLRQTNVASPATPSMIHYRRESLSNGSSTRILRHSQSHDCAHSTTESTPIEQAHLLSS